MTTPENPILSGDQLPPDMREKLAQAFDAVEAMGENSERGTVFQRAFSFQASPPGAGSNYLVRWEYSPEEWQLFDRLDWGKAWHRFLLSVALTAVLYVVIVSFFEMLFWSLPSPAKARFPELFVPLILLLPACSVTYFFVWLRPREARFRHRARRNGPRRVTIGNPHFNDLDMWLAGSYVRLQDLFVELLSVQLSSSPPLMLSFGRRLLIRSGNTRFRDTIYLPVPQGCEEEARQLVKSLGSQTILANGRQGVPIEPE